MLRRAAFCASVCVVESNPNYHKTISVTQITPVFPRAIVQNVQSHPAIQSVCLKTEHRETNAHYVQLCLIGIPVSGGGGRVRRSL